MGDFGRSVIENSYSVKNGTGRIQYTLSCLNMSKGDEPMYDVMISGYYGFRNSGDDAILLAIINNLRNVKRIYEL